jgi:O-antigen/teichoic acid export membrane protein
MNDDLNDEPSLTTSGDEAMTRKSTARAGLISVVSNVALGVAGFFSAVIANRVLGPGGRGELAAIQTLPAVLAILGAAGMPDAAVYWVARQRAQGASIVATASAGAMAASVAVGALGFLIAPLLVHESSLVTPLRVYLLFVPLTALLLVRTQPLRSVDAFGWWNGFRIAVGAVWLAAVLGGGLSSSPTAVTMSRYHLVGTAMLLVVAVLVGRRRFAGPRRIKRELTSELARFGIPTALSNFPQLLNLRVDQLILVSIVSLKDLGFYAAAVGWSWIVNPVIHAVGYVLFPAVASSTDAEGRHQRFRFGTRLGIALTILVAAGAAVVTPVLFPLIFGDAYRPAAGTAVLVTIGSTIAALNLLLGEATKGLGRPRVVLKAELIGLVATAVLLIPLSLAIGVVGAALASLVAYSTTATILLIDAHAHQGCRWRDLVLMDREDLRTTISMARHAVARG